MEDYNRSRSYSYSHGNDRMQMESYHGPQRPPTSHELRSYSTSYAQTQMANGNYSNSNFANNRDFKAKKGKDYTGSSSSKSWSFDDPEFQRKKRVASYKMYSVEVIVEGHVLRLVLKVIRAYAANKAWIIGFLMDICGALLMLRALSLAPVSVIQPVSGCGLAILSVFSHFYLKEVMNVIDWMGITLAGIGTIGVGAGGEEQEASSISIFQLPWLALLVAILFVGLKGTLALQKIVMKVPVAEIFTLKYPMLTVYKVSIVTWMASVISKMGFVFLEQGFSKMLVPTCLTISICCSATGFYYQTRGLKHGRAIVLSTCAAVASIVTGVLAGMLALGERLPSAPAARFSLLLGWLLIVVGVILLVSSTWLLRHLPQPFRHFKRSSADRNLSLIRTGSLRLRDPNPTAVIHAATLHHLISSPSKEKA
uniref:Probable magnesium transporter n=1 Tax=Salix viminalis TaxID=40686 RepID=A0A6N2L1H5_SALVM